MLSSPDVSDRAADLQLLVTAWQLPELKSLRHERATSAAAPTAEDLAYQRGWEEGRLAQTQEMSGSVVDMIAASRAAQQAMIDANDVLRRQSVATIHALSVAIARHLIEWEVTQDPTHIRSLVSRAIALAPQNGPVTVRMNPDDLAMLQSIGGLPEPVAETIELRWIPDATIGRGGCALEGPTSIVDGRVDRALLDIYERLGHD